MVMIVMIKSRGDGNILLQSEGQRVRNSGQTKILRTQETRSQHYQMSFPLFSNFTVFSLSFADTDLFCDELHNFAFSSTWRG